LSFNFQANFFIKMLDFLAKFALLSLLCFVFSVQSQSILQIQTKTLDAQGAALAQGHISVEVKLYCIKENWFKMTFKWPSFSSYFYKNDIYLQIINKNFESCGVSNMGNAGNCEYENKNVVDAFEVIKQFNFNIKNARNT